MSGSLTRIRNNQISTAVTGNAILGINAASKVQPYTITGGLLANSLTYGSDLTISGNLTVNGTSTTVNTTTTTIEDPTITLASTQTGTPVSDIGFLGQRGSAQNVAWVWKESQLEFESVYTSTTGVSNGSPTVTVTGFANIHMGNANVGGNAVHNGTTSFVGNLIGTVNVTSNVITGNLLTPGLISATGNIYGNNINANVIGTSISVSGNITGGNLLTGGLISATGTITSAANVIGGNITTAGQVSATANVTGGNILTAGLISSTGTITSAANVIGGNINTAGLISSTGNVIGGNIDTAGLVSATGNLIGGNVTTIGLVSATGNLIGGNVTTIGQVSATGNLVTAGNLFISQNANILGNLNVAGNVTFTNANVITTNDLYLELANNQTTQTGVNGAGLQLGNVAGTPVVTWLYNSTANAWTSNVGISVAGNVIGSNFNTAGLASVAGNITGGNLLSAGLISTTGNATHGNISAVANITGGNILIAGITSGTGNATFGNILTNGIVSALGNIYTANTLTATGTTATGVSAAIIGTANATGHSSAVITAQGNGNTSAQFAFQNANAQSNASADIAVYNNQGTDTTYFIDMGITSSGFNGTAYGANIYGANDGYLYVVGSSATGPVASGANVGNLILGSTNGQVIVFVGNASTSNAITTTGPTGFFVNGVVSATGTVTGGNIVLSGNSINELNSAGTITVNGASANTNFAVNGTGANIFYINAVANTASFGNSTQTTNALVSFNSTTSILLPVGNTNQRPSTGVTGMTRFNNLTNSLEVYNNTQWQSVGSTIFTVIADDQFNGDGSTTTFNLSTANLTSAACMVSINGIVQIPTGNVAGAYAVVGNATASVLTFTEAPAAGDQIDVRELTTTTTTSSIYNNQSQIIANGAAVELDITGNLIPTANVTYNLGSPTNNFKSLYVGGSTIYLGSLQLKDNGSNALAVYTSNGTTLANVAAAGLAVTSISDGTSQFQFDGVNGNAIVTAAGANTLIVQSAGTVTTGTASVTGNITGGNISATNHTGTTVSVSGNVTGGNINTSAQVSAGGNITGGNITTAGVITVNSGGAATAIINGAGNAVGNIGSSSTYFNTVFAKATSAQYADLAELYVGDADYEPGTVVDFGGDFEVTASSEDMSSAVAGVVSTNPSYLMNSGQTGEHVVAVALTGRVPCKVTGPVSKGDLMVSNGDGTARSEEFPAVGTVIGKALANFDGDTGVIEVVVGRF
jgi:hypothetical protein